MVMFAVSLPELTKVVEFTVTPAPNVALTPARKFDPRTSTERVVPLAPWLGWVDGVPGSAWIARHAVQVADCPPDVTVTSRLPTGAVAAALTLILSVVLVTKEHANNVTP